MFNNYSKLPHIGASIFTEINSYVQRYKPLNLAQGFPGFPPDPQLLKELAKAKAKSFHQYAPMEGMASLRNSIAQKINQLHGKSYNPNTEITLTAGATQAIFTAITAFVHPGDEVILFKPAYDCYEPAVELQGAKPVLIEMRSPEYAINWQEVEAAINSKTRMIILNYPHNPTGTLLTQKDIKELERITRDTSLLILSDEVYEHLVYDGKKHLSLAQFPALAERTLLTFSFGKTFHVTGWKIGYCVASQTLMKEFQKVHQFMVYCVNHPAQKAIDAYIQHPENYLNLADFFQKKRDYFLQAIQDSKFVFTPSQGTYFQTLGFQHISDEADTDFVLRLIKEKGLASIPVSAFTKNNRDDKMLRFCFAKEEEDLKKAAEILNSF